MNYRIFLIILVQSDNEYHPECMKSSFCWNNKLSPYLITQNTGRSLSSLLPSLPPPQSELLWWMCLLECVNPKYPILRVHSSCRFKTFSPSAMGTRCHSVLGLSVKLRMKWSGFFWKVSSGNSVITWQTNVRILPKASNFDATHIDGDAQP